MTRRSAPNPDELVEKHWPLDRRSHDHLRTALATAAELVRYANHVTLDDPDTTLEYAGELYAVVGAVADLVDRLPQLVRQLAARADVLAEDPTLRSGKRDEDPATAVLTAAEFLHQANGLLSEPAEVVRKARSKLAWVGHR